MMEELKRSIVNELWYFIASKGLESDFYSTLSEKDEEKLKLYLGVE